MKRVAITGCCGYIAQRLIAQLRSQFSGIQILGIDVVERGNNKPDVFKQLDIRDSKIIEEFKKFRPEVVIHLAFILNPIHDEELMHQINIVGSENVFKAVKDCGAKQFLVASSATAYGAWPDNPIPLDESFPVRPRVEFLYAADKTELDLMTQKFSEENSDIDIAWIRPCIVFGPNVDNYLSRGLMRGRKAVIPKGYDPLVQFVHEDDVVAAILFILEKKASGPFNVAPPDSIPTSELNQIAGRGVARWPLWLLWILVWILWTFRIGEAPPGVLYFQIYPWVVTPKRLTELGFKFKYSSRETFKSRPVKK